MGLHVSAGIVRAGMVGSGRTESHKVSSAIAVTTAQFVEAGVAEAELKARLLVADILDCGVLHLPLRSGGDLSEAEWTVLAERVERVSRGEPLQYVLGWTEFMGLRLKTDARALIPRPETEGLVEAVLDCESLWCKPDVRVVDVGTGSGAVILALALSGRPARFVATDVSTEALSLAGENARTLDLSRLIEWRQGDLLESFAAASLDAVVANLPYVTSDEWRGLPLEVRSYEPRGALDGGGTGLDTIARLVVEASTALRPGGWLFAEVGAAQGEAVSALMAQQGFERIDVQPDLAGRDRIVRGTKP